MSFINWKSKKIINENTNNYMDGIDYDYIEELTTNPFDKSMLAAKWKTIKHPVAQLATRLKSLDIASQMGRVSPKYYAQKIINKNPQLDIPNASDDDIRKAFAQVKISTESYLEGLDYDLIEEARGKKIADPLRAKLMGMEDIRDLKGTMTPRYFATKVIRFLQKENPELDLENLSDDDIQNAINVVSNVSKPLASRPDVKITTRERGAAKEGLKKGDTGFETLQLNLGSDTTLNSEGGVGENDLYTVVSDGLKYRVTLNSFKGQKINLDDISQDDVVSVVIVKPSETEKVDKFGGEIEMGDREKLVADFPEGEEGKFDRYGRSIHKPEEAEIDHKKADLDKDGKLSDYEKARAEAAFGGDDEENNEEKDEMKRAGQSYARAVADHYDDGNDHQKEIEDERKAQDKERQQEIEAEIRASRGEQDDNDQYAPADAAPDDTMGEMEPLDDTEEEERCPVTGKLRKKKSESEEEEQVAMSPQQVNQYLVNQHRQKMQNAHSRERMNRWGY